MREGSWHECSHDGESSPRGSSCLVEMIVPFWTSLVLQCSVLE